MVVSLMRAPGESEAGGSRRGRHIMSAIAVRDKARRGGRIANLVQERVSPMRPAQRTFGLRSVALVRQSPRYEFEGQY
ncbi:hypothetical protein PTKU15_19740 [Paraburkholderia terrae]|nr:hypothetical protein PTKU15_19740 [Paraburkholderia terrae]